jgi:hypothetical protein
MAKLTGHRVDLLAILENLDRRLRVTSSSRFSHTMKGARADLERRHGLDLLHCRDPLALIDVDFEEDNRARDAANPDLRMRPRIPDVWNREKWVCMAGMERGRAAGVVLAAVTALWHYRTSRTGRRISARSSCRDHTKWH